MFEMIIPIMGIRASLVCSFCRTGTECQIQGARAGRSQTGKFTKLASLVFLGRRSTWRKRELECPPYRGVTHLSLGFVLFALSLGSVWRRWRYRWCSWRSAPSNSDSGDCWRVLSLGLLKVACGFKSGFHVLFNAEIIGDLGHAVRVDNTISLMSHWLGGRCWVIKSLDRVPKEDFLRLTNEFPQWRNCTLIIPAVHRDNYWRMPNRGVQDDS